MHKTKLQEKLILFFFSIEQISKKEILCYNFKVKFLKMRSVWDTFEIVHTTHKGNSIHQYFITMALKMKLLNNLS